MILGTKATTAPANEEVESDEDGEDDDALDKHGGQAGEEVLSHSLTFKPLYIMSKWKDILAKDARVSVAILLPTGIGEHVGDIKVQVDDEEYLAVGVAWPSSLTEPKILTKKWLVGDEVEMIEGYHLMVENFYKFLSKFQRCKNEQVMSWCRIPLPFPVKPDIKQYVLGWEGTEQIVLFITLFAPEGNYNPHLGKLVVKKSIVGNTDFVGLRF